MSGESPGQLGMHAPLSDETHERMTEGVEVGKTAGVIFVTKKA
jgi:hypothetical protein